MERLLARPRPRRGARSTTGLHIGFGAPSRERVDEFWQAGIDAGYESDGEPGPRPEYGDDYYGGFLLDPDGNSAEAVHFDGRAPRASTTSGSGSADVGQSARFYETIAPFAGLREEKREGRAQFAGRAAGSFSVLEGDHVTKSLHMAFAAPDDADRRGFHSGARGRLPRQRHARRALQLPPRLLQRLRARPRREQRRAGEPQPLGRDGRGRATGGAPPRAVARKARWR